MADKDQAQVVAARVLRVSSATVASAPTDGTPTTDGTEPHITLSPWAATGINTTGFTFGMKAPSAGSAVADTGGFSVTPWVRNPVTKRWFSGKTVSIGYGEAWVCWGVDAVELYFQIANVLTPGNIDLEIAEQ